LKFKESKTSKPS